MGFLVYLSDYIMPLLFFYIIGFGLLMKVNVYDEFVKGAKKGLSTVVSILPTLVGLMMGVGILRASGALDALGNLLQPAAKLLHFPVELIPLSVVKMFSSSAATGLLLDIYQKYGTDSLIGRIASISMSCTETIFYTLSVYYMTAKVNKTRWTLPGALLATVSGLAASVMLAAW
ncbi:MAG: spore maturation protein [Lachnospiraceae bacterium]|nr:spore maturation protein [Lachnospiraceae bacterium]